MSALAALTALADQWVAYSRPSNPALTDDELLEEAALLGAVRRLLDTQAAANAADIALRSRVELGYAGLAQRLGARTPENLLQQVTGATKREAITLVRSGNLMASQRPVDDEPVKEPWLAPLSSALGTGALGVAAVDVVRGCFEGVEAEPTLLLEVVTLLVAEARELTVEQLAARARQLRDQIDEAGIEAREQSMRHRRYLRLIPQFDGMTKLVGLLDPESAARVAVVVDAATSPRRGGPRPVSRAEKERHQRIIDDERDLGQLSLDVVVELIELGAAGESSHLIGAAKPTVRLLLTDADLHRGSRPVTIEGQTSSVSIATARRHACVGFVPVLFDQLGEKVINIGRAQRLFTSRQREGLAALFGGCAFPGCDCPPSWTEAHHVDEWEKDHGNTDLADGMLLCRHHHLLIHNNGWQTVRRGNEYFFIPPASRDRQRRPIAAVRRGLAAKRLRSGAYARSWALPRELR